MEGLLGRKIGMTQIYQDDGGVVPVTILRVGPCVVVQRKTESRDGYDAVQLGLVDGKPSRRVTKPRRGHFRKAGVEAVRQLAEFGLDPGEELGPGDQVKVTIFEPEQYVDVVGTSKGKGFQGVIKRHGFAGGRSSHGSMFHRAPGSIGASAFPSRVFPGMRATGQMGAKRVTTKNLKVIKVVEDENLLYLRGAVPGGRNSVVQIRRAKRG